ncbi:GNAT family N-acetyltransferase [Photobacterium sp. TY1-4]|uniref:GNAT family N-acetyltransferase n=1 Tax=Photobacterium sp. TY1-4 TaxID=2899122 RepID=UPI0021C1094A|nr:GNAT family N-acetyltransferase [Photobacterium sp. TY1-4]UXI02556.1 GNAT family N-acetyltransferase [Photobacterium sp. TY1-4]
MPYQIRKASIDDVNAIAAIHVASWSAAYDGLMPQNYIHRFTLAHREKQWANIIGRELAWVFVAEDQSGLLGFLCCGQPKGYDNPKTYELSALYIAPTRYHSGIGSCLYDTCEKHLLNLGGERIELWALAGNHRAHRFYQRHGFQPTGSVSQEEIDGTVLIDLEFSKNI